MKAIRAPSVYFLVLLLERALCLRRQSSYHDTSRTPPSAGYLDFLNVRPVSSTTLKGQEEQRLESTYYRPKAWPPWPFNVLSSKQQQSLSSFGQSTASIQEDDSGSLLIPFLRASTRAAVLQTREIASQLWLHSPPSAPPLVLLALWPQKQVAADGVSNTVIPLFTNPFVRTLAMGGVGLAVMSWAHTQLLRKRLLVPLPLKQKDINRAVLPPFLPEVRGIFLDDDDVELPELRQQKNKDATGSSKEQPIPAQLKEFLQRPTALTLKDWRRMRRKRQLERQEMKRKRVIEQCIALQQLKKHQAAKAKGRAGALTYDNAALGYALVTGASGGVGRAIAVELARWEIPLILVARNIDRLTALAYDLEACYGIKCCVLKADLTQRGIPECIHEATKKAGLKVDILINNAGISTQGRSVDLEMNDVEAMIQLNVAAVSTLAHLYGKDMKDRRRGRILMVSSICGAIAGIPSVAVYSATKAFEKTLSISMAKELEEFGVGVTCLLPGAVSDTDFRKQNNAHDALCWKIPYYPTAPSHVAEVGVRAMLMGDSEVTPGLMNRAFLKVLMPIVPQRLHNWVAEIMWNPLNLPFIRAQQQSSAHSLPLVPSGDKIRPQPLVKFQASPRVLSLEDSLPEQPKAATETTKTMEDVKSNNTQLETVGEIHPARSDINYDSDNVARPNDTESTESSTTTYN